MTKRKLQILKALDAVSDDNWTSRATLKASLSTMQELYFDGLVDGAAIADGGGYGTKPHSNLWQITDKGRAWLRENT